MTKLAKTTISESGTIKQAMEKINANTLGTVFIVGKDSKLMGVVTDGDIRRALINGVCLGDPVQSISQKSPLVIYQEQIEKGLDVNNLKYPSFANFSSLKVPVVDKKNKLLDLALILKDERGLTMRLLSNGTITERPSVSKVLVIGGAGYLGSVLCGKLLEEGYEVSVLDNLLYGEEGIKTHLANPKFHLIRGDVRSLSDVVDSMKGTEAIIYLAAIVGDFASSVIPQKSMEINFHGTMATAEIAKYYQIKRFIYASSCSVYGASSTSLKPLGEKSRLNPVSLYARTKIQIEEKLLEMADRNFCPTIMRMATLFGISPRMRFDLVVNYLTAKAYFDKKITIFGGNQYRPFLHVTDAAQAYITCLKSPLSLTGAEVFNVGSDKGNFKLIDVGKEIHKLFPKAVISVTKDNTDPRDYFVDFSKIERRLKYKAVINVPAGIQEMKRFVEKGNYRNYQDQKYSNYQFLLENSAQLN